MHQHQHSTQPVAHPPIRPRALAQLPANTVLNFTTSCEQFNKANQVLHSAQCAMQIGWSTDGRAV